MTCEEWRVFLQDYIDGRLSEPAKAAIDRHVSECPSCFADARSHRRVSDWLGAQPLVEPPPGLADRILANVLRPAGGWRRELARLAAAAAILIGVGGGLFALANEYIPREKVHDARSTVETGIKAPGQILQKAGY